MVVGEGACREAPPSGKLDVIAVKSKSSGVAGFMVLVLLWSCAPARAADVRCLTGPLGYYGSKLDYDWYHRHWPSGARPTKETCSTGFIYGPIQPGHFERVLSFYRGHHPFLAGFALASPGGDVEEALKIGRFFRKYLIAAYASNRVGDGVFQ